MVRHLTTLRQIIIFIKILLLLYNTVGVFRGGSTLGQRGHVPPHPHPQIHLLPLIQKLADRSDVIFEVPKCSKMQIFRSSAPDPAEGVYSAPPDTLADGEGARCYPPKNPTLVLGPSGLVSTGYRIGNHNNRFQM